MNGLRFIIFLIVVLGFIPSCFSAKTYKGTHFEKITMPPGFTISIFAEDVPNARSMVLSPNGVLFVGTHTAGNVYAVVDRNKDNRAGVIYRISYDE